MEHPQLRYAARLRRHGSELDGPTAQQVGPGPVQRWHRAGTCAIAAVYGRLSPPHRVRSQSPSQTQLATMPVAFTGR